MLFFKQVLILGSIFVSCNSQGAPWSEEETSIISQKVAKLLASNGLVRKKYLKLHPEAPNYTVKTNPNAQKANITFF